MINYYNAVNVGLFDKELGAVPNRATLAKTESYSGSRSY